MRSTQPAATTVERAWQSSQLEGGRSSRQARALQRSWVDGELTYAEFGAELDLLRPTVDRRRKRPDALRPLRPGAPRQFGRTASPPRRQDRLYLSARRYRRRATTCATRSSG
ncbi:MULTISPECIES: hypothetical protein [unclassified Frondihabitans]|uniref:antitoxin VbhA family protein n=1 Tax=unclassified Frondihabitans TaxID=2626248 RepID=UPI001315316A